ncbi:MAG: hypothetical protein CBD18_06410 [Opitutales bacterium TMED158]|nr:MAG: hypothetical protein CBD18_06410 [Opitutales bacterium TMED158]
MENAIPISDLELESLATEAVGNVFSTMLDAEAQLVSTHEVGSENCRGGIPLPIESDETLVAGTVGFIGTLTGVIYIFMDASMALKFTGRLLDLSKDEIEEEGHATVNDAVGELTNMIVGAFKNDLSSKGYECRMTIPSILRGSNYTIEPTEDALRRIFKFDCEGGSFVIDILIKEESSI